MIRVFKKNHNFFVQQRDLDKLLESDAHSFLFCGMRGFKIPQQEYYKELYWEVPIVIQALKHKISTGWTAKLSSWKKTRIEYLIKYLESLGKIQFEEIVCIND